MHERQAIRQAIVSALVGTAPRFATSARDRVTSSRQAPIREAELPTINVYLDSETVKEVSPSDAPRELERTAVIVVEGWVTNGEAVDDALDALALEIETALDTDPFLAGAAADSWLTSTDTGIKIDGSRPLGCVHLEYAVTYRTNQRAPLVTDDFTTADARFDLAGEQAPDDQAHDVIDVAP